MISIDRVAELNRAALWVEKVRRGRSVMRRESKGMMIIVVAVRSVSVIRGADRMQTETRRVVQRDSKDGIALGVRVEREWLRRKGMSLEERRSRRDAKSVVI